MSTETTAGVSGSAGLEIPRMALPTRRTLGQLIAISLFWFAINFHWAAVGVLIVPSQVIGLLFREAPGATLAARASWTTAHEGLAQALVVAPGLIIALLSNPFFGLLSDRTPGRLGRRRPYVLGGTLVNVVGLGAMALAPVMLIQGGSGNALAPSLFLLMGGLMITQLGSNAAAAPFHAFLPDLVPAEQRGLASGIMGMSYWLGTICGSLAPTLCGFNSTDLLNGTQSFAVYQQRIVLAYGITAGVIVIMAVLTTITVHETPWHASQLTAAQRAEGAHTLRDLGVTLLAVLALIGGALLIFKLPFGFSLNDGSLSALQVGGIIIATIGGCYAFGFRPRRNPDFSWVVITRVLVMMGVYIVQNFLLYYMQNVAHAQSPQGATTLFLIILTVTALLSTTVAGWASDRVGRKRMVYIAGSFMAVVGAAFILAPYLVPGSILTLALIAAGVFGLGYGAYVSVDWALVADVLPSEATFARDMGVWNIALTAPQVLAVVLGGWLLALGIRLGYPEFGYTLLFVVFVVFCVLGTVTIRNIRSIKR